MFYQVYAATSQMQCCNQCKGSLKKSDDRFFCCERKKFVCGKCSKTVCKQCKKRRENKIKFGTCCIKKCQRKFDRQDMFYDFKGGYQICPKCLRKEYQYHYQKALKADQDPQQVQLITKSVYPYKDLINYFKNWCFSCASSIGNEDAYQMIRGPRICSNCIAINAQAITRMIRCISCEGYIHTLKEIFQTFGSAVEVICIYCAQKHKEEFQRALNKIGNAVKQPSIKIAGIKPPSVIKSALKLYKVNTNEVNQQKQPQMPQIRISPSNSRISSAHSIQFQELNVALSVLHQKVDQKCHICDSYFNQWNLFSIKESDKNLTSSILKVLDKRPEMKMCALCFGEHVEDRGQTIQFDSSPTRTFKIQEEENMKQPEIIVPKISLAKQGASQKLFKNVT